MARITTKKRQRRRMMAEINVVPYIDVMLVLLVIFMIATPLLTQGVNVDLPKATAKALPPKAQMPLIISVTQDGQYFLNVSQSPNTPLSAQALTSTVNERIENAKQHQQTLDVYVKGDQSANYGTVVQAMVLLQRAGASNVGLITDDTTSHS